MPVAGTTVAMSSSTLSFQPLHPTIGAECSGVDFSAQPVPGSVIDEIRAGMAKYGFLVFRKTGLDNASHIAFAGQFGELDDASTWIKPGQKYRLEPYFQLNDVSNIELDGSLTTEDSLKHQIGLGNGLFHVDCSYNPRRAGYSLLLAHQLPPKGTGGGTEFADTRTAYEDLDGETKDKIDGLALWHSLWYSRILGAPDNAVIQSIKPEEHGMARHKLVQTHEPSGRTNLYIAAHAHHVDGWSKEQSQPLIQDLLRHASQEKYRVRLDWENKGDLVIWDNTCVMHRAAGGTFAGKYARDLRRATVHDGSSSAWGLNEKTGSRAGMFAEEMEHTDWVK